MDTGWGAGGDCSGDHGQRVAGWVKDEYISVSGLRMFALQKCTPTRYFSAESGVQNF